MNNASAWVLKRIAQILDLPESAFFGLPRSMPEHSRTATPSEVLEMVNLFATIDDPKVRRACIDYLRTVASEGSPRTTG